MPQLTIKVCDKTKIEKVVKEISVNLADIVDITPDRVFITIDESAIYQSGEQTNGVCIVNIAWLKRSLEMRKAVGGMIRETLSKLGFETIKIAFEDVFPEDMY